jgi:hypothetical protein
MRASLLLVCLAVAACDGKALTSPTPGRPDGAGVSDGAGVRVPVNHRASGALCPAGRGPGSTTAPYCSTDGGPSTAALNDPRVCESDDQCTEGANGRCFLDGGPVTDCGTNCSYDACASDTDCPANEPCQCRASASDPTANSCLTGGNCRVDADCGPGGYCSPSQIENFCFCPSPALCPDGGTHCYAGQTEVPCSCGDSCGHSYYCHTASDGCVDDGDCPAGETCNYDTVSARWDCATCWPVL